MWENPLQKWDMFKNRVDRRHSRHTAGGTRNFHEGRGMQSGKTCWRTEIGFRGREKQGLIYQASIRACDNVERGNGQ